MRLVERALVKDYLQIPRADTMPDAQLKGYIEHNSADAERLTRRWFEKKAYTEYFTSYEQAFAGDPQRLSASAFPIDTNLALSLSWSWSDYADGTVIDLDQNNKDFTVEAEKGFIRVFRMGSLSANLPILSAPSITYAERGFRLTYTGGYAASAPPNDYDPDNPDPLDDYGVIQVPDGLKNIIARKCAMDYNISKGKVGDLLTKGELNPTQVAMDNFRLELRPWEKKDQI